MKERVDRSVEEEREKSKNYTPRYFLLVFGFERKRSIDGGKDVLR